MTHFSKKGFSLIELLISLIVISCITAAFTPVITKKMKSNTTTVAAGYNSEISTDCPDFSEDCQMCTKSYCIMCQKDCSEGAFLDSKFCRCNDCKDTYGENCVKCDAKKVIKCKDEFYIKDNKCTPCQEGCSVSKCYCDGVNQSTVCREGFYCTAEGTTKSCQERFGSSCLKCTSTGCSECSSYYFLQNGSCVACSHGYCIKCTAKGAGNCTQCQEDAILSNGTCIGCKDIITGCFKCKATSTSTVCTSCMSGYYLDSNKGCTPCSKENCYYCENGKSPTQPVCKTCKNGYYPSGGNCIACSEKFGANCTVCDTNKCLSCKVGYSLSATPAAHDACKKDSDNFNCSDSNFMRIGNLCVTRKNMGDSQTLAIPATSATIVKAKEEYCYSTSEKCCWQGTTSVTCDETDGYSTCTRTACNKKAAESICKNFNYAGKKWRLPTDAEVLLWHNYSANLGSNGLMICASQNGVDGYLRCMYQDAMCLGGYMAGQCRTNAILTKEAVCSPTDSGGISCGTPNMDWAASVRCVTEME